MENNKNQIAGILPRFFKPKGSAPLIRYGRENDGGYLLDRRSAESAQVLVSGGVNDDFSFEEAFLKATGKKVVAYDATITHFWFLKRFIKDPTRLSTLVNGGDKLCQKAA